MLEIDQTRKIVQKTNRGVANGGMAETEARGAAEGVGAGQLEEAGLALVTSLALHILKGWITGEF